MAKKKEKESGGPAQQASPATHVKHPFEIKEAKVKDDFCNYRYLITSGVNIGDTHSVKGTGIVDADLTMALQRLNVHLATVDDVFKHSGIEVADIDKFHNHDLTGLYDVSGFKLGGSPDCETVVIIGTKYVNSAIGRMGLDTPEIPMAAGSGYVFYNELKAAVDILKEEVALYARGKCTKPEKEEQTEETEPLAFDENSEKESK